MVLPSSCVLGKFEIWTIKKAECPRIDTFILWCWRCWEPLDYKIKPRNPLRNQPGMFIGRTDAEASILRPFLLSANSLEKTLMLGKTEGKRRRKRQDEMARYRHRLNGHELEQTPGDTGGQRSLAGCSPWGCKRVRHNSVTEQQHHQSTAKISTSVQTS